MCTLLGRMSFRRSLNIRSTAFPALTRRSVGAGSAWYLATFPDPDGIEALVERLLAESGVAAVAHADQGVELTRRRNADGRSFVFAINHSHADATVNVTGAELLSGERFTGYVPAGARGGDRGGLTSHRDGISRRSLRWRVG